MLVSVDPFSLTSIPRAAFGAPAWTFCHYCSRLASPLPRTRIDTGRRLLTVDLHVYYFPHLSAPIWPWWTGGVWKNGLLCAAPWAIGLCECALFSLTFSLQLQPLAVIVLGYAQFEQNWIFHNFFIVHYPGGMKNNCGSRQLNMQKCENYSTHLSHRIKDSTNSGINLNWSWKAYVTRSLTI